MEHQTISRMAAVTSKNTFSLKSKQTLKVLTGIPWGQVLVQVELSRYSSPAHATHSEIKGPKQKVQLPSHDMHSLVVELG